MENLTLEIWMPAPDFTIPDSTGKQISLYHIKDKNIVLYFYPKDNTPGCTAEALSFQQHLNDFAALDTVVVGISMDNEASHSKFSAKHNLQFTLLSDQSGDVCRLYGVYKEKNMYGKKKWGIERSTFIIDKAKIIRKIYRKVKVAGHAEEVLKFLQENQL